jgi:N-acetylglucosaminyl-diphospho-decaprenol L-rhamnosyltransferase
VISLVLVTFRSAGVVGAAVTSFRREAERLGRAAEVVMVDHSEDAAEREQLAPWADRFLAEANRGYAAGINAGLAASDGDVLLVGNPDVVFPPGSLAALLQALEEGWDLVGPQLVIGEMLLPPADRQTPGEELARWLAARSRVAWRRHLRAEVRRWRRAWEATAPLPVPCLSGSLLAFTRSAAGRVGPWDERYFLYFEETDWLRRAAAGGLRIGLVPAARVVHLWGQAADPAEHAAVFLASRRRFLRRHFGRRGAMAARLTHGPTPLRPAPLPHDLRLPARSVLWLASPTAIGIPAAGLYGDGVAPVATLTEALAAHGRTVGVTVMAVDLDGGRLLGCWRQEA